MASASSAVQPSPRASTRAASGRPWRTAPSAARRAAEVSSCPGRRVMRASACCTAPSSDSPRASPWTMTANAPHGQNTRGVAVGLRGAFEGELQDELRLPPDEQPEGRRTHDGAAALGRGVLRLVQGPHTVVAETGQAGPAGARRE